MWDDVNREINREIEMLNRKMVELYVMHCMPSVTVIGNNDELRFEHKWKNKDAEELFGNMRDYLWELRKTQMLASAERWKALGSDFRPEKLVQK